MHSFVYMSSVRAIFKFKNQMLNILRRYALLRVLCTVRCVPHTEQCTVKSEHSLICGKIHGEKHSKVTLQVLVQRTQVSNWNFWLITLKGKFVWWSLSQMYMNVTLRTAYISWCNVMSALWFQYLHHLNELFFFFCSLLCQLLVLHNFGGIWMNKHIALVGWY